MTPPLADNLLSLQVVFGIYGLAFLLMGFAVAIRAAACPASHMRHRFFALAAFGIIHGVYEWMTLAELIGHEIVSHTTLLAIAAVSFLPLFMFALGGLERRRQLISALAVFAGLAWSIAAFAAANAVALEVFTRMGIAVPGAFAAAIALLRDSSLRVEARATNRDLIAGSLCFGVYGLLQLFSSPGEFFPASVLNTQTFEALVGMPPFLARAAVAVAMTVVILRLLGRFDQLMWQEVRAKAEQLQAELSAKEAILSKAQRIANIGSWEADLRKKRLTWSDQTYRIFGLQPEEFEPSYSAFLERVHPQDREMVEKAVLRAFEDQDSYDITHRIVLPSGELRTVHEQAAVEYDVAGQPVKMIGTVQDITERRQAEQSLAESEQRLRTAAKISKLGYYVWDIDEDRCIYCSEEYARIHGVSQEDYLAASHSLESDAAFVHPEDREIYRKTVAMSLEQGRPFDLEYRIVGADGELRHVREIEHSVIADDGRVVRTEGLVQDITEIKRAEEQLQQAQKMEAVGQLTGGVAHDFNNLLTVILGNLQLIERRIDGDERLAKRVDTAKAAATRGAELTKSLLAFSRLQRLEAKVVDLNEAVLRVRDLLTTTLGEAIELRVDLDPGLHRTTIDPAQLESALLNLVINARDAMPEGGRLTIETVNVDRDAGVASGQPGLSPGSYVMLSVTDTGCGMSPEVQKHAFEPFFTTKDVGKGSGLGLSMVFGFIKQSGGHVALYSEEGAGTSFKLFLPAVEAEEEYADEQSSSLECPRGDETILVVEDQEEVRQTSLAILEELGYRVYSAGNGPSALELLDRLQSEIDLLFTDIVMPQGMNGLELAEKAREMRPDLKVLYTSGFSEAALKEEGEDEQARYWLAKPFFNHTLAQKVREVLDRS